MKNQIIKPPSDTQQNTRANTRALHAPIRGMLVLGVLILSLVCAQAATVTLQQGVTPRVAGGTYLGTSDSWLDESAGSQDDNYGASHELRIKYDQNLGGGGFADDHTVIKFELPTLSFSSVNAATLELFYFEARDFGSDNALGIKPYRIAPNKWWYENNGGPEGKDNEGVNYLYRDQYQTLPWTGPGAWNDKIDDGNGTNLIKRTGGTVPGAIEPGNWVPFNVQPSIAQWYGGASNNGFGVFSCWFQGGGNVVWGRFSSRDTNDPVYRPKLTISYQGAHISWAGAVNSVWDTTTTNWNVGGYLGRFGAGDFVTFADGASNPNIAVVAAGVSPGSITISNSALAYSFSGGSIGGAGGITKRGTGLATLANSNNYGGLTLVEAGRLIVSANGALGTTTTGTIVSNGAALGLQNVSYSVPEPLTIDGSGIGGSGAIYTVSGANTFGGPVSLAANSTIGVGSGTTLTLTNRIAGTYNLTKVGAGTLTFAGSVANTYSGVTYVNDGVLALAKTAGTAVPGALVIGNGVNSVGVILQNHGQLDPHSSVTINAGSQLSLNNYHSSIGSLTLSNGSVMTGTGLLTLGGPVTSTGTEMNTISGNLDLGGVTRAFNVGDGAAEDDLRILANIGNILGMGPVGITKLGPGRLVLGGNNTYDGETVVESGVLTLTSRTGLGLTVGGTVVNDGGRLELRGALNDVTVGVESLLLNGYGGGVGALRSVSGNNSWAGPIALGSTAAIAVDPGAQLSLTGPIDAAGFELNFYASGNVNVAGPIAGAGSSVVKTGPAVLTFSGSVPNTYSGSTIVTMGNLALAKQGAVSIPGPLVVGSSLSQATVTCHGHEQFGPSATATVNAGSTLNLNGFNATLAGLALNDGAVETGAGTLQLAGPIACSGLATATINGNISFVGSQNVNVKAGTTLEIGACALAGGFSKLGWGMLVLSAPNMLDIECLINEGTVLVVNDPGRGFGLGPGPVRVSNRAVLGGTGSICGRVRIDPGGILSPGRVRSIGELVISNDVTLWPGSVTQIEIGGPAPAIDVINLRHGGVLDIDNEARLELIGQLGGDRPPQSEVPYVFIRGAQNVIGTFMGLPNGAPVPGQPGWYIHYGTHRVYFSTKQQPIAYFRAFSTNGVVVVMWRTAEEVEVTSFDLYRLEGSDWIKVNEKPIPAQSPFGAVYYVVDRSASSGADYRYKLVANTSDGDESWEFDRQVTEFAFSAMPRIVQGGVEVRWWSRTDEAYDLQWTEDIGQPLVPVLTDVQATPPECIVIHQTTNSQGFYRVRMVP